MALPKLGLNLEISLDDATAAVMEWAAAEGVLTTLTTTRRRLDRMDEDEANLIKRADALGERLGLQLPKDALAKVELLQRRWSEHQAQRTKHEALANELQQHQEDAAVGEAAAKKAASVLEGLHRQANVLEGDTAALAEVRRRHLERRKLRATEQQLLQTLVAAGDGLSETELRTDWQGTNPDALRAEETKLTGDVEALEANHAQAIEAARALGDLSENGDYHAAKDTQGKMEARIRQLQALLKGAEVVEAEPGAGDQLCDREATVTADRLSAAVDVGDQLGSRQRLVAVKASAHVPGPGATKRASALGSSAAASSERATMRSEWLPAAASRGARTRMATLTISPPPTSCAATTATAPACTATTGKLKSAFNLKCSII